jgi:hypothetical protein
MRGLGIAIALALAVLAPACRSKPGPPRSWTAPASTRAAPATPHPLSVRAQRYTSQRVTVEGADPHRTEELWFPDWKINAYLDRLYPDDKSGPPDAYVHAYQTNDPEPPLTHPMDSWDEVQVPWELAQRIRAAAELHSRYSGALSALAPDLAASGLLRDLRTGGPP